MYGEIEAIIDEFGWTLEEAKSLSFRERRHWHKRAQYLRNQKANIK